MYKITKNLDTEVLNNPIDDFPNRIKVREKSRIAIEKNRKNIPINNRYINTSASENVNSVNNIDNTIDKIFGSIVENVENAYQLDGNSTIDSAIIVDDELNSSKNEVINANIENNSSGDVDLNKKDDEFNQDEFNRLLSEANNVKNQVKDKEQLSLNKQAELAVKEKELYETNEKYQDMKKKFYEMAERLKKEIENSNSQIVEYDNIINSTDEKIRSTSNQIGIINNKIANLAALNSNGISYFESDETKLTKAA